DTALAPGTLRLEVSENAAMDRNAETAAALAHLKHLGVRIDIDDFGTGYCSLERLHRLPVDALKVDRSFVAPLDHARPNSSALVRSIVTLAHTLGLQAVAEGVETPLQERTLKALHCERAQGRRFSEPVDDAGVLRLLALADAQRRPHRRTGRVGAMPR
ncbi:MAG TPA: EAL domain-containing protein, partial [Vicinamibacteria bacterium]|nr:EAL domain-containing protein [Vicinamibacteria bacterium]